jgi:hypothetical protein
VNAIPTALEEPDTQNDWWWVSWRHQQLGGVVIKAGGNSSKCIPAVGPLNCVEYGQLEHADVNVELVVHVSARGVG